MDFKYTDDNKRYHTLSYYNKHKYGKKIFKAVIDAGFTCPNKDGTKGSGGCIFCRGGSGYFTGSPEISVSMQLKAETERIRSKYPNAGIIAYFQANTNTYSPADKLRDIYIPTVQDNDITGISIGTRGDCISEETADFLRELSNLTELTVELGMQTVHDSTLKILNTGYTHEEFLEGFFRLKKRNIRTCLHIINGLPYESEEMMIQTSLKIAELCPDAVKIQLLHILKDTPLEKMYTDGKIRTMEKEDYISVVVSQLERLSPEIVIERITGDGDKKYLVAPKWSADKISILGGIDKEFVRRDTFQGKKFKKAEKTLDF